MDACNSESQAGSKACYSAVTVRVRQLHLYGHGRLLLSYNQLWR
jgi:hypothetical protein